MKNLIFLFLAATLVFASCEKDDDCNSTDLASIIVGEWNVTGTQGSVEFQADGDFIDNNEILVFNFDQVDMEYTVDSQTQMHISVPPANYTVIVQDFDCDEVNLSVAGFDFNLKRK